MGSNLDLKGMLNLQGMLTLNPPPGGKVTVNGVEVLVELPLGMMPPHCVGAPPVILPPPPAAPKDPGTTAWVYMSPNKTVKVKTKSIVVPNSQVMQGQTPTWPGIMQPGANQTVKVNNMPISVVGDQATILVTGTPAVMTQSGQVP